MRDLRDLSKLPSDQAYWVELEARMREAVGADGQMGRWADGQPGSDGAGWWTPLGTRAGVLTGLAIAAGIAALLLVPPRSRGGGTNPTVLFRLPDDPTMAAFLSSPTPPSLAAMLASLPRSEP
jgi:hypothetical protein